MKIFIIYASAGAGHKRAAQALAEAYKQKASEQEVELFDALDYSNSFFKWAYGATYLFMISYLPSVWGFFYYLFDFAPVYFFISPFRKAVNFLNSRKLRRKLINEKPDVVISTHFFACQVVGRLIAKDYLRTKLITVLTDFLPHYFWINRLTHFYCVPVPMAREILIQRGVVEEKIIVLGIPVSPVFLQEQEKHTLREKLNFGQKKFVVLIASGGYGVGPVEKMLRSLDGYELDMEIVMVCGKNPSLYERLKKMNFKKKVNIFGFVDNMHELMKASDLIITKSGGLSVSEALACRLPIVVIRPVFGQETRNCFILTRNKLAVKVKNLKELKAAIYKLARDGQKGVCFENFKTASNPRAAFDIIDFVEVCNIKK